MTTDLRAVLELEVPVIVELAGRAMTVRDVLALAPGSIIQLPKQADKDLEVLVNNKEIGLGQAVKVGENFGVRMTFVGDVRDRIKAMGGMKVTERGGAGGEGAAAPAAVITESEH